MLISLLSIREIGRIRKKNMKLLINIERIQSDFVFGNVRRIQWEIWVYFIYYGINSVYAVCNWTLKLSKNINWTLLSIEQPPFRIYICIKIYEFIRYARGARHVIQGALCKKSLFSLCKTMNEPYIKPSTNKTSNNNCQSTSHNLCFNIAQHLARAEQQQIDI